jgi:hypothetical protein
MVGRNGEFVGDMPAGAVLEDHRVGAGADGLGEFIKHRLHGDGIHSRQHQGDAGVARRTDRAEQVDRLVAQVAHTAWAHPALKTAPQLLP